jgi:hypothetical protein
MNKIRFCFYFAAASFCLACLAPLAKAEQSSCATFFAAVEPDKSGAAAVVPDTLLVDQIQATPCLIEVLRALGKRIGSVADMEQPAVQLPLLSATSALRRVIATANGGNELKYDPDHLKNFIDTFRDKDDIDVVSALSYAARSSDKDLRLNAVLILGNVIDNSTVCVPVIHLNDSTLLDSPGGLNGRANLLGIISVVVPWAYKQNFESITATVNALENSLVDKADGLQTFRIIKNVKTRSLSQSQPTASKTNKDYDLETLKPGDALQNCQLYLGKMNPPISPENRVNLKY